MTEPFAEELEIDSPNGSPLIVRPSNRPPVATVLFLHWFDESPNANRTQFVEEATSLADLGVASILPQLEFPWHGNPIGLPSDLERIHAETGALLAVLDAAADKSLLVEGKCGLVGHDFGAMHGVLLMTHRPFECGVLIAPTPRWSDWFLPFWPIPDNRYEYMKGLHDVDPITLVGDVHSPLLFQFARNDFYIAPMTGGELVNAANEPKTVVSYEAEHNMDHEGALRDRRKFLVEHLGLVQ